MSTDLSRLTTSLADRYRVARELGAGQIAGALPYPPDLLGSIVAVPDGRTLYIWGQQSEANTWLVKRSSSPGIPQ
jgi:hypothetical protein